MRLLLPLGLLALLGLLVLLIIYLIKPSYQNKSIPSTYIWRESLKYRKKQETDSIFRNLLIILCQILIIVLAAFILSMPLVQIYSADDLDQNILVIDGSANMRAASDGSTRFERAVSQAREFAEESIGRNVPVSIILAGEQASYIVTEESSLEMVEEGLSSAQCSYATGDIEGAMQLADALTEKSNAQVYYYTGTEYRNAGGINVIDVSSENDWNACVLDVRAESVDNYYTFYVDVAVYGSSKYLDISLAVNGMNDGEETVTAQSRTNCADGETVTVKFSDLGVYSFEDAEVSIRVDDGTVDSFENDDTFYLYGGTKETIRIQYASSLQNNFFTGALLVLQSIYADRWDIELSMPTDSEDFATSGYDFYIFEHSMPSVLPTDGVVFLVNPSTVPRGLDLSLGGNVSGDFTMTGGVVNPIMNYIDATAITATTYRPIMSAEGFETLMYCEGDGVFVVRNDAEMKVAVLTLNLNTSNLAMLYQFPTMIVNMFDYFIPQTIQDNVFDVGEAITIQARGTDVKVVGGQSETAVQVPATVSMSAPGSYTVTQMLATGRRVETDFYVKIASSESNLNRIEDAIPGADSIEKPKDIESDIYLWLAVALFAVIFLERFLQAREKI